MINFIILIIFVIMAMKTVSILFDNWIISIFWFLFILYYTPDVCMQDYVMCKVREATYSLFSIFY